MKLNGLLQRWLHHPGLMTSNRRGIVQACLIGAVAGLSAGIIAQGVEILGNLRLQLLHTFPSFVVLPLIGLVGGFIAGWLVQDFGPEATGSGIPQVKAALERVKVALDFPTALVKLLGGTLVLGSGFFMGREGPTVHVAASLASEINRIIPTTADRRRQLIAAGAGAGLAAAFHAPMAGVMFVLEELLHDVSGRTIGTAVLACFVGSVAAQLFHASKDISQLQSLAVHAKYAVSDIPWYLMIGILAGVFGALFNRCVIGMLCAFRDFVPLPLALKVALAGLLSGLLLCLLPPEFADYTGMRQAMLAGHCDLATVCLAFAVFFFLTILAYGSGAPGGLFAPSLMIGTALGYGVAALSVLSGRPVAPESFAIAGMGGMFASVARVPITAIIIIFEMTQSFELVLPLMIVCVVSSAIAERIYSQSIYDRLMEWGGIKPKPPEAPNGALETKLAQDIMLPNPITLDGEQPVHEALDKVRSEVYERFPVLSQGKLVGIANKASIESLAHEPSVNGKLVNHAMNADPVSVAPSESLLRVLSLFEEKGLDMLPVTEAGELRGVITRSDLIHHLRSAIETKGTDSTQAPNS